MIALLLLAEPAGASLVLYNTRTDWLSAVSGVTVIDFAAQSQGTTGFTFYNTAEGLTVSGVNFVGYAGTPGAYNLKVTNPAYQPTFNRGTGPILAGGWSPNYLVATLPGAGVYALALDYSSETQGRNITIVLSTGETYNLTSSSNSTLKFFGFTTDVPVTSISFSASNTNTMIDNFSYADPVAEPESILLGVTGLLGIWLARRMRPRAG